MLKSTGVIQSEPHRLEEWGDKNMMKFNKDKSKCLQLKKKSPQTTQAAHRAAKELLFKFCEDSEAMPTT